MNIIEPKNMPNAVRDLFELADLQQQSLHLALGELSRHMKPGAIEEARDCLDQAEAKLCKLKFFFDRTL